MIHHISISARDPEHVAAVLAELMDGRVFPFPGRISHSSWRSAATRMDRCSRCFPKRSSCGPAKAPPRLLRATRPGTNLNTGAAP